MRPWKLALLMLPLTSSCVLGGKHAVNLYGGYRSYSGDFGDVSEQPAFGLEGMIGLTSDGVSVEGGYTYAEDSGGGSKLKTDELYAGLRKTWGTGHLIQPYVALGVDWMQGDAEGPLGSSASGDGFGAYGRVGVGFQILLFQAGVDLRGVWSGAEVGGEDLTYVQPAIFIGLSF